jgi:hypothetical protein
MLNLEIISTPIGGVERWVGPGEPESRMSPSPNYGGNDFLAPHLDGITTVLQQFANKDGRSRGGHYHEVFVYHDALVVVPEVHSLEVGKAHRNARMHVNRHSGNRKPTQIQ